MIPPSLTKFDMHTILLYDHLFLKRFCRIDTFQGFFFLLLKGLATIPVGPFYSKEHRELGRNYTRFCFIKVSEDCLY